MRHKVPRNRPKVFVRADAHYLPFRNKVFDVAFSYYRFEHLEKPEQAMREIARVGKKSYFVTDHFLSIFCYFGGTQKHVWMRRKWYSLTPLRPTIQLLSKLSIMWQHKRPLSEKITDKIFRGIEKSVIVDCQIRRTVSFRAIAEDIRKTTRMLSY